MLGIGFPFTLVASFNCLGPLAPPLGLPMKAQFGLDQTFLLGLRPGLTLSLRHGNSCGAQTRLEERTNRSRRGSLLGTSLLKLAAAL